MAVYEAKPVSAIRYMARVASIEPWQDSGKLVVNLAEEPRQIGPIAWVKGGKNPYGVAAPRYTSHERLESAKTLDDLW
jgi:hypothetical protein